MSVITPNGPHPSSAGGHEREGDGSRSLYTPDRAELVSYYVRGVRGLRLESLQDGAPPSLRADGYYANLMLNLMEMWPNVKRPEASANETLIEGPERPITRHVFDRVDDQGNPVMGPDGKYAFRQSLGLVVPPVAAYYERIGEPEIRDLLHLHSGPNIKIPQMDFIFALRHVAYDIGKHTQEKNAEINAANAVRLLGDNTLRLTA